MSSAQDYIDRINRYTANELFDNFSDFCDLDQESQQKRRQKKVLAKPSDLNVNLLKVFDILADEESPCTPVKIRTPKTTATKESPYHLTTTKCKSKTSSKKFFSKYLDVSDIHSPNPRKKYSDVSIQELSDELIETSPSDKSIFKLEKPILSNKYESINFKEMLDKNLKIKTKTHYQRKKTVDIEKYNETMNMNYCIKPDRSSSRIVSSKNGQVRDNSKSFKIKTKKTSVSTDIENRHKKMTNSNISTNKRKSKGDLGIKQLDLDTVGLLSVTNPVVNIRTPKNTQNLRKLDMVTPRNNQDLNNNLLCLAPRKNNPDIKTPRDNQDLNNELTLAQKKKKLSFKGTINNLDVFKLDIKTPKTNQDLNNEPNLITSSIFSKQSHSYIKKMNIKPNLTKDTPNNQPEDPFVKFMLKKNNATKQSISKPSNNKETEEINPVTNFRKTIPIVKSNSIRTYLKGLV